MKKTKLFLIVASTVSSMFVTSISGAEDLLNRTGQALSDIAKKAVPAIVSINTVKEPTSPIFGQKGVGIGSGVIIRSDGTILTNNHVVENAERVVITFDEKHKTIGRVIGADPKTDLAIIKPDKVPENLSKQISFLKLGSSDEAKVGDWVIAIGNPFGLNHSVTFGIISAKSRGQMGVLDIEDFIQTDAAINPGSSGGALLNANGELIGISTAIFSEGGGFMGIGFAVPSRIVKEVIEELLVHGRVIRGWIGITAQDINGDLARYFKVAPDRGALISGVLASGPADQGSIKTGDVVLRYNGTQVENVRQLKSLVAKTRIGTMATIELKRDGGTRLVSVAVSEQPDSGGIRHGQKAGKSPSNKGSSLGQLLGMAVEDLPAEIKNFAGHKIQSGAFVADVRPGGSAYDAGLTPGDIILKANKNEIRGASDFISVMKSLKSDEVAVLYVQRGVEEKLFIPLKLNA